MSASSSRWRSPRRFRSTPRCSSWTSRHRRSPRKSPANLLQLMTELKARGMAIVFTTHRLPEAFKVADRFVVLRDGRVAGRVAGRAIANEAGIVEMMVGRPMSQHYPKVDVADRSRSPCSRCEGLSGGMVKDVSFFGRAQARSSDLPGWSALGGRTWRA